MSYNNTLEEQNDVDDQPEQININRRQDISYEEANDLYEEELSRNPFEVFRDSLNLNVDNAKKKTRNNKVYPLKDFDEAQIFGDNANGNGEELTREPPSLKATPPREAIDVQEADARNNFVFDEQLPTK